MAYAILAGLPPVYGLYTAFVFIFLFFSFFLFYENSIGGALLWFHVAVNICVCMCVRIFGMNLKWAKKSKKLGTWINICIYWAIKTVECGSRSPWCYPII